MTNNNKNITGNFGGGGRQPTRDPDTLNNTETGKVVEILSEGITEGFATPSKEFAKGTVINNYNQIQEIYSLSGALQDQYIAFAHEDIFLDDTPIRDSGKGLQNSDGTYQTANFNGFHKPSDGSLDVRHGSLHQQVLTTDGTLQTEKIIPVNQKVSTSITKQITVGRPSLASTESLAPERIKVTLHVNSLQESNDKGDLLGRTVEYKIFFQYKGEVADLSPTQMLHSKFEGRTGDMYRREHLFATESFNRDSFLRYPLEITVTRVSPLNEDNDQIQDDLFFSSMTEIQRPATDYQGQTIDTNIQIDDGKGVKTTILGGQFSYPMTAYTFLQFDAYQFQNIPKRTFRYRGVKVRIPYTNGGITPTVDTSGNGRIEYPSNYIFNGVITNELFWTTDPAFILLDLLLNTRYGFGNYIKESEVDLYSFYEASKYSAQLIQTSEGLEPRFAFNGVINKTTEAYNLIQQISGMMRCYPIWSGGKLTLVQDRPINPDDADACTYQIPTYTFSLANTIDGFSYSGVSLKTRHGKIVVEYFNMRTRQPDTLVITNNQVFAKTHNIKKVKAFGCTSFFQAARYARNIIWSENHETDVVTFDVSIESGVVVRPGAVVGINDPVRAGIRRAGRVSAVTLDGSGNLTALTVDDSASTDLPAAGDRTILIVDSKGQTKQGTISSISGKVITLSSALAPSIGCTFQANTIWLIEDVIKSKLYRIVDVEEQDEILYKMTGIPYDCNKYAFVDGNSALGSSTDSLQNPVFPIDNRVTSILDVDRGGPSSLTGVTFLREKEGQVISVLSVSFTNVFGCKKYLVRYKFKPGAISNQGTNIYGQPSVFLNPLADYGTYINQFITEDLTFEIENASVGTYRVEVFSINAKGKHTASPTIKEIQNLGKLAPPVSPTSLNFEFTQSGDTKLTWPLSGDVDVTNNGHVIIKHNDDTSGAAVWGNSRTIMIVHGSQTSVTLPTITGEYLIKYQDQSLIQSTNSVSAIITTPDLMDQIVIGTIKENTDSSGNVTFSGVKTALSADSSGMEINQSASNTLIDSITALIDTISNFDTLDGDTGVLEGSYQFAIDGGNVVDLGGKFSGVIIESIVRFEGFTDSNLFDSYVPAIVVNSDGAILSGGVDALTSFDGDILENATVEIQVQTSDDNVTYSSANSFIGTVITARYLKFIAKLKTTTTTENTRIIPGDASTNTLGCRLIMNRRTETSALLTSNTTSYTFTNAFFGTGSGGLTGGTPSVTINPQNLGTGEFFEVSNITATGFNVVFKNSSGAPLTNKQFYYAASGFGKKL